MSDFEIKMNKKIKEIRENPGKIFGLVYPYVLVIGVALGLMYISNLNDIARQSVPPRLVDTLAAQDLELVKPRSIPPLDIVAVSKPSQDLIEKGAGIYANICASCHGIDGIGNGPAATGLNPPPRDLTSETGWKNGTKISQIYQTLEEGIPGSAMISYSYMTPEEKISLAHYIRSAFLASPPKDSEDELQMMDQVFNLSQGREVPAQIPVAAAMTIIAEENRGKLKGALESINKISQDTSYAANLFDRIVSDKTRAAQMLAANTDWRNSRENFQINITTTINDNGFNNRVYELSENDWNIMFNYLSGFFR